MLVSTLRHLHIAAAIVLGSGSALAQVEPNAELPPVNGMFVGQLDAVMGQRGYVSRGRTDGMQLWWNQNEGRCVATRSDATRVLNTELAQAGQCAQALSNPSSITRTLRSIFGL
jgi:hypothetical protein